MFRIRLLFFHPVNPVNPVKNLFILSGRGLAA